MPKSFTHLHTHTEFSMLDGASKIDEVVAAAAADGMPALGITDHGNMYGVLDFYKACQKAEIKPIIGSELYQAHDSRFERPNKKGKGEDDTGGETDGGKKLYYHLIALAETMEGYKNLIQLASRAFLEGYYYKPRVDWDLLSEHSSGLIVTSGCLGGQVLQALLRDDFVGAKEKAGRLQDIFGRDNFFIEVQDHGIPEQLRTNPDLYKIAKAIGAPLLATNDSHYTNREDHAAHDALLCIQTGAEMSDPTRFKFQGSDHYLRPASEMRDVFSDHPEACDNTLLIAERCDVEIEFGKPQLPDFPLPPEFAPQDGEAMDAASSRYLEYLTFRGAKERYGDVLPDAVVERIAFELKVIADMGFSQYFLITWDLIRHARDSGIRVGPGRGSAAGCCVAYALKITDLDPIKYDLLFERFLNPSRVSMPDIDMDFDSRYRDEMIRYATERYGRDHVAQIVTFSTIKARAAVRDAARVLGEPYILGDKIAKAMPPLIMGRDTPLWACLEESEGWEEGFQAATDLRAIRDSNPDAAKVLDVAVGLEDLRRGDGIHAAAVVITQDPLTEYLPIQRKPEAGQEPDQAPIVTQYEMHGVEDLGLLKMDFLGLRNLDVIDDAVKLIKETRGIDVDIDNVDLDDDKTFQMLRDGDSIGVFQLEGQQMRDLMRSLAPTSFDDIAALVALYRPGLMAENMHNDYADRKNGRQAVTYWHEDVKQDLDDTYGLMIYQESMMRVAQRIAGYSLAEADNLRKACGKKIRALIQAEREKFIDGAEATGYGRELGTKVFDVIEPFADYAFNKSHAYGYGYIAYQTAYLKANYPVEYFTALLTSVKTKQDRAAIYLNECRKRNIPVLVPDVNTSAVDFTALLGEGDEPDSIPFALSAIHTVGEGIVGKILEERSENGAFTDFYDFCERVPLDTLNKKTIEAMIKAGCFDSMGHPRRGLLEVYVRIIDFVMARRKESEKGVMSLFGELEDEGLGFDEKPVIPDMQFDKKEQLAFEKEMLGLYVSDHPLMGAEGAIRKATDFALSDYEEIPDTTMARFGGVVTELKKKWTKKGDLMAIFTLEDLTGSAEVVVFPRAMHEYRHILEDDVLVVVKGRVDKSDDRSTRPKILANSIEVFEPMQTNPPLRVRLPAVMLADKLLLADVRRSLANHPGSSPVLLDVEGHGPVLLGDHSVDITPSLLGDLKAVLSRA